MAILTFKRKEMKYIMTEEEARQFMASIQSEIAPTEFPVTEIRNLYLDTNDYEFIRRSIAKPVFKEKLRIRSYGDFDSTGRMFYEMKKKYKGVVYKRRFDIASDALSAASVPVHFDHVEESFQQNAQTVKEWNYWKEQYEDLMPRFFLSYDRLAYMGMKNPEVRLTFDRNLTWREDNLTLSGTVYGNRLLEDQVLLEIKVPGSMPLWISRALSEVKVFPVSYSKIGAAYEQSTRLQAPVYAPHALPA